MRRAGVQRAAARLHAKARPLHPQRLLQLRQRAAHCCQRQAAHQKAALLHQCQVQVAVQRGRQTEAARQPVGARQADPAAAGAVQKAAPAAVPEQQQWAAEVRRACQKAAPCHPGHHQQVAPGLQLIQMAQVQAQGLVQGLQRAAFRAGRLPVPMQPPHLQLQRAESLQQAVAQQRAALGRAAQALPAHSAVQAHQQLLRLPSEWAAAQQRPLAW